MSEQTKQALEIVANNPKAQLTAWGFFSSPFWIDYGSHAIAEGGKVISFFILITWLIRNCISTYKEWKNRNNLGDK